MACDISERRTAAEMNLPMSFLPYLRNEDDGYGVLSELREQVMTVYPEDGPCLPDWKGDIFSFGREVIPQTTFLYFLYPESISLAK
jgi:hypothetical protein